MTVHYTQMSYRDIASSYNRINFITDEAALEVGRAVARITGPGRVVDLGGGAGRITVPLAAAGLEAVGLDLEYNMLQAAGLRATDFDAYLGLVNGDVTRLPFPNESFDGAITTSVLHLVPDWHKALAEAARVIKPGSRLIIGRNVLDADSCAGVFRSQLRRIAGTVDPSIRPTEAAGPALFDYLTDTMGGKPDRPVTAASWKEQVSPNELLTRVRERTHNEAWALSEETHREVVAQLTPWVAEHFDDPDRKQAARSEFILYAIGGLA
ncbi:MAG: class I SAM-dependent methyltransferase [Pseudomonadota bacterium]